MLMVLTRPVKPSTLELCHAMGKVMVEFSQGSHDVLVCTTIIESGLDLPNVNTIIVQDSGMFGLAQLYQLRGRVGRSGQQAYAYLLYEPNRRMTETAEKRLRSIFEATDLGSGFKIAMKDLEIRGAGNLLGPEQSGFMNSVGFDLYCRLVSEAVEELRGKRVIPATDLVIDLPLGAHLPDGYVGDPDVKVRLYRRLAALETLDEVEAATRFIETHPLAWTPMSSRTRRCRMHRFPFGLFYQVRPD